MVSPQAKREAVGVLMKERQMGITRACGLVGISRSLYSYESRRPGDEGIRTRMLEIAGQWISSWKVWQMVAACAA